MKKWMKSRKVDEVDEWMKFDPHFFYKKRRKTFFVVRRRISKKI